jgi:hypothetical protein
LRRRHHSTERGGLDARLARSILRRHLENIDEERNRAKIEVVGDVGRLQDDWRRREKLELTCLSR